jgi:hypothetical protein
MPSLGIEPVLILDNPPLETASGVIPTIQGKIIQPHFFISDKSRFVFLIAQCLDIANRRGILSVTLTESNGRWSHG